MKRLVALLLVVCLAFGLVACSTPSTNPTATTGSTNNGGTNNGTGNNEGSNNGGATGTDYVEPNSNDQYINPEFAGKTLQLWGLSSATFDDIENMVRPDYEWMIRVAIDEWATLNDVTIEFGGDYNEAQIMSAINNGDTPDLLLQYNKFPAAANQGIVRAFTEDEYNKLVAICGSEVLDMVEYQGEIYGLHMPWAGYNLFYYNKTMFENYDAKTPKEYYLEGNWNWDTMAQCWEDITKDLDGDGTMDTYGIGCFSAIFESYPIEEDENGNLYSTVNSDKYRKQREIIYKGTMETGSMIDNNSFVTMSRNPRPGTMCNDAEWYNYSHLLQTISNGDVLEVVPVPCYDPENPVNPVHIQFMSILTSCDEPEATMSLLSYILKVGQRCMAEWSVGLFECEYEGLRAVTEYGQYFMEYFNDCVVDRTEEFAELEDWDQEFYEIMVKDLQSRKRVYYRHYLPENPVITADVAKLPTASAMPQIEAVFQAYCEKYNSLYAN